MIETNPRICAVITEETVAAAVDAMHNAGGLADMLELRLDYLRDFDFTRPDDLRPLLEQRPLPTILTCRSFDEGGKQRIGDRVRLRLIIEGAKKYAEFCDVEAAHYHEAASLRPDPSRLIVSYHNFDETPRDIDAVCEIVCALPAAIHKIVIRANDIGDSLAIFRLLDRSTSQGRNLIALAMGAPGVITRILGPSRGSYLTYGPLSRGMESAPGQITCGELSRVYRIKRITRNSIITGIIGQPVMHSASPAVHNAAFEEMGLDYVYLPFEVSDAAEFLRQFINPVSRMMDWNVRGLSVTIPHKTAVMPLLDEIDPVASTIGAVNTVVVEDGRLRGYNTDAQGFIAPLLQATQLAGKRCAVLGAGGAARAVLCALKREGALVTLFARDAGKGSKLGGEFDTPYEPLEKFGASDAEIVVNATPIGMHGHSEGVSPVPPISLRGRLIAYDLVYNPLATRFLADAASSGCRTITGLEMLVSQAAAQFEMWTGMKAPVDVMRAAALGAISS